MKGIIYSLNAFGHKYIGATTNMARRRYDHNNNLRNSNKKDFNSPLYTFLRNNGCDRICKQMFITHWEGDVSSVDELKRHEQEWINKELPHNKPTLLNTRFAYGADPEKLENRKVKRKCFEKKPVEQIICECGVIYSKKNKAKHETTQKHLDVLKINDLIKKVDDLKDYVEATEINDPAIKEEIKNLEKGVNPFAQELKLFPTQYCEPDVITLQKNDELSDF